MAGTGKKKSSRRKKRSSSWPSKAVLVLLCLLIISGTVIGIHHMRIFESSLERAQETTVPDWIDVQLLDVDGHSRNGKTLTDINNIVIHYVGNPGTSAQANHDYFASSSSRVSSHFLVGLEGEVIQCIPLDEWSAASNDRNPDTISIEVCHPDASGKFSDATYQSLVKLTAWLCDQLGLDQDDLIRHYDVTGKECPKYFVDHPDSWEAFKEDVKKAL